MDDFLNKHLLFPAICPHACFPFPVSREDRDERKEEVGFVKFMELPTEIRI